MEFQVPQRLSQYHCRMHQSRFHHTTGGYNRITRPCAQKRIHQNDAKRSTMHPWLILDTVFFPKAPLGHTVCCFFLDLLHEVSVLSLCLLLGLDSLDAHLIQASVKVLSLDWVGVAPNFPLRDDHHFLSWLVGNICPQGEGPGVAFGDTNPGIFGTTHTCLAVVL